MVIISKGHSNGVSFRVIVLDGKEGQWMNDER